ncbi:MAG: HAMP domain-containing histidine kinase, partial [Methanonatronarchaeia archaeon]
IKIEDDGKGIPKEKKKKIFEKGIKSGENAGSGLGLYLAKEITSSYGGEIECSSSQGEGTEFTIKLERA